MSFRGGSSMSSTSGPLGKPVTTEKTVNKFSATTSAIGGTAVNLSTSLKDLEADLKKDKAGKKEYEGYLADMEKKKAELKKRIEANKMWVATYGNGDGDGGAVAQYKELVENIGIVYNNAKDSHAKGINMLIKEFDYHLAYKRWNDSFSSIPFKPK